MMSRHSLIPFSATAWRSISPRAPKARRSPMSSADFAALAFDGTGFGSRPHPQIELLAGAGRTACRRTAAVAGRRRAPRLLHQPRRAWPPQGRHGRKLLAIPPLRSGRFRGGCRLAPVGQVAASVRARARMGSRTVSVVLARWIADHAIQIAILRNDKDRARHPAGARAGIATPARRRAHRARGRWPAAEIRAHGIAADGA